MAQDVSAAFTAEEVDNTRNIIGDLLVSWKKESTLGSRTFTIGVSLIGGNDFIGINPGAIGSPGNYSYFDESDYLLGLAWERGLNMPLGGLSKGMAEARLENTDGRFTPRYMGGQSELFTSILPRRPFIINAGFNFDGIDQTIPQFSGVLTKQPQIDVRSKEVHLVGSDYTDFFSNRYLDQEVMFTGLRTDEVYEDLLQSMGLSTAQYVLDTGINIIPFGLFEKGTRYSGIFHQLAEAENGHFYQDEEGVFRFENRQHWDSSPHNSVSRIVLTGQVIDAEAPNEDHIINVVEIRAQVRNKQPEQTIFKLNPFDSIPLAANVPNEIFVDFEDPVLSLTSPTSISTSSFFKANTIDDGSGTDISSSVSVTRVDRFAKAAKIVFLSTISGFLTDLVITGRPARVERELYYRDQDGSSVTAYEERSLVIENPYIQNESWAASLSRLLLEDYSDPENLQIIVIRAIPSLQLGDMISWQGRHWRVFDIKTTLIPSQGFTQELLLLQREITSYFRIGISTIQGDDKIAP